MVTDVMMSRGAPTPKTISTGWNKIWYARILGTNFWMALAANSTKPENPIGKRDSEPMERQKT